MAAVAAVEAAQLDSGNEQLDYSMVDSDWMRKVKMILRRTIQCRTQR
jgi:hypothetical protein